MYVHPEAQLNKFKDVKIPSAQELALLYGERLPQCHGDDLSSGIPDNAQGLDNLDRIMIDQRRAVLGAAAYEEQQRQSEARQAAEPTTQVAEE